VTRGTIQDEALLHLAPKTLKIQRFEDDNATMAAFMTQQTQFVAVGAAVGAALAKNPKVQAEYKLLIKDSPNYIGVRKGETALLNKVNDILRTAKQDGTLNSYSKKWLGRDMGNLPD
jgi:polar amino acid transport system substrate-binding protein